MKFTIEVKFFDGDASSSWRGRAIPHVDRAPLNFQIPLPEGASVSKVEAATVYELSQILPRTTNPGENVTVFVSTIAAKDLVQQSKIITSNFSDLDFKVEVTNESDNN